MQSPLFETYIKASFLLALIGMGLLYYALKLNKKANVNFIRIGLLLVIQLILLIISEITFSAKENKRTRPRIKYIIENPTFSLSVNGQRIESNLKNKISTDLRLIKDVTAHHSHPIDTIRIKITSNNDTLNLIVGQDSMDSTEYWIHILSDHKTRLKEVGRFYTKPFMFKMAYK